MLTPEATAALMAMLPEWKNVPSPMFWNMWGISVKGAIPIHCAPSPPICVMPKVCRSMPSAMAWQPMPAAASEPSGTTVERLCGQPLGDDLRHQVGVDFTVHRQQRLSVRVELADNDGSVRRLVQGIACQQLD